MIKIKSPFRSAGIKYKWPYKPEGVGIAKNHFDGDGDMEIELEGKLYKIDRKKARDFVNQYKSYYVAGNVPLGVLPTQILERITNQDRLI